MSGSDVGQLLARSVETVILSEPVKRVLRASAHPSSSRQQLGLDDDSAYLRARVWEAITGHVRAIKRSDDPEEFAIRVALIANTLRGRQLWEAARCCLDLLSFDPTISRRGKAHLRAAQSFLEYERGNLADAEALAVEADALFGRESLEGIDHRVHASLLWKLSHMQMALRLGTMVADKSMSAAIAASTMVGDLHGYSNSMIARAHRAVAEGEWRLAIDSVLLVLHPPTAFKDANRSAFTAAEVCRLMAVLEMRYLGSKGRPLGFANPLHILRYAEGAFGKTTSRVMRVPYLGTLAIADPRALRQAIGRCCLGIPKGAERPRFSRIERERIFERFHGLCSICGYEIDRGETWHVDHIVFHSMGKPSREYSRPKLLNYRPLHADCNTARGSRLGLPVADSVFEILRRGIFRAMMGS